MKRKLLFFGGGQPSFRAACGFPVYTFHLYFPVYLALQRELEYRTTSRTKAIQKYVANTFIIILRSLTHAQALREIFYNFSCLSSGYYISETYRVYLENDVLYVKIR